MSQLRVCPRCGNRTVNVRRSRPVSGGRSRTLVCLNCSHRWITREVSVDSLEAGQTRAKEAFAEMVSAIRKYLDAVEAP